MQLTMAPDINVLVAASRTDHPHHQAALNWLNQAVSACLHGGRVEILPMVAAGFLRLTTHPKIFLHPTPVKEAAGFIDALLGITGVEMPELGREWPLFTELCRNRKLAANDIPDAWIAATVTLLGSHLVTFDRGFSRLLPKNTVTILNTEAGPIVDRP